MTDTFNDIDRQGMIAMAEHYDPAILAFENEAYVASIKEFRDIWGADLTVRMEAIMAENKHD